MSDSIRTQKQYDHRLSQFIQATGDLNLTIRYGVPCSTARGWRKQAHTNVVSFDVLDMDAAALQQAILVLRRRVVRLLCLLQLVVVALKLSEFSLDKSRVPDGSGKQRMLRAIERARVHMPFRCVLQRIGMSRTRYHAWHGNCD